MFLFILSVWFQLNVVSGSEIFEMTLSPNMMDVFCLNEKAGVSIDDKNISWREIKEKTKNLKKGESVCLYKERDNSLVVEGIVAPKKEVNKSLNFVIDIYGDDRIHLSFPLSFVNKVIKLGKDVAFKDGELEDSLLELVLLETRREFVLFKAIDSDDTVMVSVEGLNED